MEETGRVGARWEMKGRKEWGEMRAESRMRVRKGGRGRKGRRQ